MAKFIDKIKEKSAKYSYDKKINAKYTDEERIYECQKNLQSVQNHHLNQSCEKKEKILKIIFGLGHPLNFQSSEFEPVLKIILEQSLIEMIKIYELQGRNPQEYYSTLEAINKNLYCILQYRIKQKDAQLAQLQIKNNQWKTKIINKELRELFDIQINKAYITEKEYVNYVVWRKDQFFQNNKKIKTYKYFMLASFSAFVYIFNWRKLYTKTKRWQNYLIIGLAALTYYLSNKF